MVAGKGDEEHASRCAEHAVPGCDAGLHGHRAGQCRDHGSPAKRRAGAGWQRGDGPSPQLWVDHGFTGYRQQPRRHTEATGPLHECRERRDTLTEKHRCIGRKRDKKVSYRPSTLTARHWSSSPQADWRIGSASSSPRSGRRDGWASVGGHRPPAHLPALLLVMFLVGLIYGPVTVVSTKSVTDGSRASTAPPLWGSSSPGLASLASSPWP
jgi:hypothetical protein